MPSLDSPESRSFVLRDDLPVPEAFEGEVPEGATVLVVQPAGPPGAEPLGVAVLTGTVPVLKLERLWLRSADVDARSVGELVRARATTAGAAVLAVEVPASDPVLNAVADGTRVLGEHLEKQLPDEVVAPPALGRRPMTEDELGPWVERQLPAYAEDNLDRTGGDLGLALERARRDFDRLLPHGLATPDTSLVVLTVAGDPVGHLWLRHHRGPGLSYVYDVEVAEQHRGQGYGRAAMLVAEVLTRDAGDRALGLHVFGPNVVARRLYLSLGYEVLSATHDLLAPE